MLKKLLSVPVRYQLWRPLHWQLILADLFNRGGQPVRHHLTHLHGTIDWLCRAQDVRVGHADSGGISAGWSFEDGWLPSYPETSGYIVETFLDAAALLGRQELVTRAQRILDWELSIQLDDGAFPGHFGEQGSHPVIFNTGQIMHGMNAGHERLGRTECLAAAVRAGHWMLSKQDDDGCWRRSVHNGIPHTYNSRSAWALLKTGLLADDRALRDGAIRNLDWVLTQQNEAGWFATNGFTPEGHAAPFTHTIAYAIRGLLESGLLLDDERYINAARRAAGAVAAVLPADGALPGTLDQQWQSDSYYVCLTGVAQMSMIWSRLIRCCDEQTLQPAVDRALHYLKRHQRLKQDGRIDDGAIAGSSPLWGRYSMFEFPNWAGKFFADALMFDLAASVRSKEQ